MQHKQKLLLILYKFFNFNLYMNHIFNNFKLYLHLTIRFMLSNCQILIYLNKLYNLIRVQRVSLLEFF